MSLSSVMNTALSGMQTEQNRLLTAAGNIAGSGPMSETGSASDTDAEIDLANELLNLRQAEIGYKANALVLEAGADLWDVLMTIKRD
ncbi:flagellar basal body rod protein [Hoeflea sp.]|uniref:flagellar basal body rod protein n=1 Tax=Hoeflea sp. TaxID=1940281 RepID=UPI003A8F8247